MTQEDSDEQEEICRKSLEINPNDALAHYNYAILLDNLDRETEAEEHYKKALEINPNDTDAHVNYAILLDNLDRKAEAEEHYKKALEINPNDADAHNNYAILLDNLDRKAEAEEHYKKALEINPNDADAHNNYAILLDNLDRKAEAEEHYKKALEINPNYALVHNNYAEFLRRNVRFYEAEMHVRTALRLDPNYPSALATLGDILADEDYFEEAIKEYLKALNSPDSKDGSLKSEIRNNLGYSYAQLRQDAKAQDEFKKAKSLDPMNIKAIRNLRAINKAIKYLSEPSRNQIYISAIPFILLIFSYVLFLLGKLSETPFIAQSTLLMALIIFVLYSNQLAKFKMGAFELEMSERSPESNYVAVTPKLER